MSRFKFFLGILVIIIIILIVGLFRGGSDTVTNDEGFVISSSKTQKFSLVQKEDNVFSLVGQISDSTHPRVVVRVRDSVETTGAVDEINTHITNEPFNIDIEMPENRTEAYIDVYLRDNVNIAVCTGAIRVVNSNGSWTLAENANTAINEEMLKNMNPRDYTYSDSELLELPQGVLALSDTITKAHSQDYDKAFALYQWLCEHIYIDNNKGTPTYEDIFNTRVTNVEGYANYFAAMLRAKNIPCAVIECSDGYFFNRAYLNDEWVNIQIDRDTFNTYVSHRYNYSRKNLYTHFGTPMDIISVNYTVVGARK